MKKFLLSWKDYTRLKKIKDNDKEYVFYAETTSDWSYLDPIIVELSKEKKIIRVTSDIKDKYLGNSNTFFIGDGAIRTFFFKTMKAKAFVMTLTDLGSYYLKKSYNPVKYFYIFHSIVSTHRVYNETAFDNYDIIFCVGNHHVQEIEKRENIFNLKKKKLYSHGYGKLDSLILDLNSFSQKGKFNNSKDILIAPTWGDSSIVKTSIFDIIEILLQNSYGITLRFHPMTIRNDKKIIEKLKAKFSSNKQVKFDNNFNSNESYIKSKIMISDWSGAAIEYAFATVRPVIFIDTKPKTNNLNWNKLNVPCIEDSIRGDIGEILSEKKLSELPKIINKMLNETESWNDKIKSIRDKTVFNLGKSGIKGAEMILQSVEDKI